MGGNYLNSILATQECKRNGYDEAILLDLHANISEAPGENIFMVKNDILLTPPLESSALEGITRDSVMKLAEDLGYQVKEKEISRSQIYLADEVFLTGTAAEITPIMSIDGKKIGSGKVGKVTKNMMSAYMDVVMAKNEKYFEWLTPVY
jgi:branched-chain amino acid aminotransferase